MIQNKAKTLLLQLSNADYWGTVHMLLDLANTLQTQLKQNQTEIICYAPSLFLKRLH